MASLWFIHYLHALPFGTHVAGRTRDHMVMWTDASSSPPVVAAVLWDGFQLTYTNAAVEEFLMDQLLARGDNQIGVLECLAVVLGLNSFSDKVSGALLTLYVDNQGVLGSIISGASSSAEVNMMVARIWLTAAVNQTALAVHRVESAANIADAPSRNCFSLLCRLGAVRAGPSWPAWLGNLWDF